MIIETVDLQNIEDAARVHSASWQESHRSFCSADFIALHTPEHQQEYLSEKISRGSRVFMLVDGEPAAVVSVTGSLIEDLYVLPCRQNKGYGTEALKRSVEYGFNELGLTRIYLGVYVNNPRAIHVYENCGFKEYKRDDVDVFMEITKED